MGRPCWVFLSGLFARSSDTRSSRVCSLTVKRLWTYRRSPAKEGWCQPPWSSSISSDSSRNQCCFRLATLQLRGVGQSTGRLEKSHEHNVCSKWFDEDVLFRRRSVKHVWDKHEERISPSCPRSSESFECFAAQENSGGLGSSVRQQHR